jgi:alkylhydroperoxidase/carboxymuconolactone decarboxylase family protein YurZ
LDADDVRARLDAIRERRGFLLPHHGALAAAAPDLLDAYSAMYRALTLERRHLDELEKEFVWLAILIATNEAIGTHHLDLFRKAGGTDGMAEAALRLAALAAGAAAFGFVELHWADRFGKGHGRPAYEAAVDALLAKRPVPRGLADLALAALHAARGDHWGTEAAIAGAYARHVPETKLVEALALVMWPAGVNRFLDACAIWHRMMRDGSVAPSPPFRAWAETPLQGGFDDRLKPG